MDEALEPRPGASPEPSGHRRFGRRRLLGGAAALTALAAARSVAPVRAQDSALPDWVRRRAEWGAAPAGGGMRRHVPARVTVHHTGPPAYRGSPDAASYLRVIQLFHTGPERRWPDLAYHLLIGLDGAVWEGRDLAFAGDSATEYDPAGHLLVALLGDYEVQQPNPGQIDALRDTVSWLLQTYELDPAAIAGHRDYAATACPGVNLYRRLPALVGHAPISEAYA